MSELQCTKPKPQLPGKACFSVPSPVAVSVASLSLSSCRLAYQQTLLLSRGSSQHVSTEHGLRVRGDYSHGVFI